MRDSWANPNRCSGRWVAEVSLDHDVRLQLRDCSAAAGRLHHSSNTRGHRRENPEDRPAHVAGGPRTGCSGSSCHSRSAKSKRTAICPARAARASDPAFCARLPPEESKVVFGDLIIPKKTIYVGEVVPVELRFYFDANYPVRLPDRPTFSGDGFTVMRFSKPIEKQQEVAGRVL